MRAGGGVEVSIGAMERYTWVRFAGNSPPATTHTCTTVSKFSGAMERYINASTHRNSSSVRVDV